MHRILEAAGIDRDTPQYRDFLVLGMCLVGFAVVIAISVISAICLNSVFVLYELATTIPVGTIR